MDKNYTMSTVILWFLEHWTVALRSRRKPHRSRRDTLPRFQTAKWSWQVSCTTPNRFFSQKFSPRLRWPCLLAHSGAGCRGRGTTNMNMEKIRNRPNGSIRGKSIRTNRIRLKKSVGQTQKRRASSPVKLSRAPRISCIAGYGRV